MSEKQYVGDGITVLWHSERCIHSAHCATTLPRVFQPQSRPWIDVEAASAAEIRAAIDGCPSGALGYVVEEAVDTDARTASNLPSDEAAETPVTESVTVAITANGPLEINGTVRVLDANGELVEESGRVFLCRCGHSANKPYCDGSHKRNGFEDSGVPERAAK